MSAEHENTERFAIEHVLLLFRRQKVAISHAIRKPFPFLEGLRDHELITNKTYEDFQDSCRHLVPVQEVIYKALNELEKIFDMRVLQEVFNDVNVENYPDLKRIGKSFENVLQIRLCSQGGDTGDPNSQLSLEQGWRSHNRRNTSLFQGNQAENHRLSDSPNHTGWRSHNRRNTSLFQGNQAENHRLSDPPNHAGAALLSHGVHVNPCSVQLVDIKRENSPSLLDGEQHTRARANDNQESEAIVLSSDDSDDENFCSEDSTLIICQPSKESREQAPMEYIKPPMFRKTQRLGDTSDTDTAIPRKRRTRANRIPIGSSSELSSGEESQECLRSGSDTRNVKKNPTLGKGSGKGQIRKRRTRCQNRVIQNVKIPRTESQRKAFTRKHVKSSSQRGRKTGPRIPKQMNVDFNRPKLPVTCGSVKGTLYKEKLKQGIYEKSIQSENGQWFTPSEFEKKGNCEKAKKWRQSIRCFGWTLGELIKEGKLPNPPRKREKNNPPNPQQTKKKLNKACTVCGQQRRLYPCAVCGKLYHKRCHIPPVENKRSRWCCVFCETEDRLRCQENQACHKESEVLKRKMSPEEQLKCELLLLTIYCYPKSDLFIPKPKPRKDAIPDLQEHMWLNKIKNRLNKKTYHSVQRFVEDMRLIFQNHSKMYKNKFKNLRVTVGAVFEETFKRIFSIKDTSKEPGVVALAFNPTTQEAQASGLL